MGMRGGFERKLSRKAARGERRHVVNENRVISNKYRAAAGQSAAAMSVRKACGKGVIAASRPAQSPDRAGTPPIKALSRAQVVSTGAGAKNESPTVSGIQWISSIYKPE
jgi:hypothetical protein